MASIHNEKPEDDDPNPLALDADELTCLSSQVDLPPSEAGYKTIYRYATRLDILVMILSAAVAAGAGSTMPLMTVRHPDVDLSSAWFLNTLYV